MVSAACLMSTLLPPMLGLQTQHINTPILSHTLPLSHHPMQLAVMHVPQQGLFADSFYLCSPRYVLLLFLNQQWEPRSGPGLPPMHHTRFCIVNSNIPHTAYPVTTAARVLSHERCMLLGTAAPSRAMSSMGCLPSTTHSCCGSPSSTN